MAIVSVAAGFTDRILSLPGWLVLVLVFAFPALEASAFVGFVFPGEIVVILGGVAASRGTVPLWAVIAAAVSGAIIGDSAGYLVGRRWGTGLLHGTVGRLPVIRTHLDKHLDSARAYVRRRQGSAVFFGRFTAALRVLVPGLAGISEVHYPAFLVCNVAGGTLWGAGFAVLGYVAGASYHRVEKYAGQAGLILLGLIVAGLITSRLLRRLAARSPGLKALGDRAAAAPPLAWVRRRFPARVAWARRRLDARSPRGFWLTFTVAAGALAAWAFGGLTQDVTARDDAALADPHVTAWVIAHRTGWLNSALQVLTWLGSTAVIIPAGLAIGLYFVLRRRDWRPLALLAAAVAGAVGLYDIVKLLVGRPRPPAALWLGHYTGAAFPSGHATQSVAFYAMLAIVPGAALSIRRRAVLWGAAALVVLIVGASRVYLGAHWLTDVLAGYALGATWVAIVIAALLITSSGTGRITPAREGGQAPTPGIRTGSSRPVPPRGPLKHARPPQGQAAAHLPETRPALAGPSPLTRKSAPRAPAEAANNAYPPPQVQSLLASGTASRALAALAMITLGLAAIIPRGRPDNCLTGGVIRHRRRSRLHTAGTGRTGHADTADRVLAQPGCRAALAPADNASGEHTSRSVAHILGDDRYDAPAAEGLDILIRGSTLTSPPMTLPWRSLTGCSTGFRAHPRPAHDRQVAC